MRYTLSTDVQALGRMPLFSACAKRQLRRLDGLFTCVDATPGQVLSRRDEQPGQFVIILGGVARALESTGADRLLRVGDTFGSLASGDSRKGAVRVSALAPTTVAAFGRDEFEAMLRICPAVRGRLYETANAGRQPRLEQLTAALLRLNAAGRVS